MEKEKIIEEMARDICECYNNDGTCYQDDMPCDLRCEHMTEAQFLYDKGYRKHNEMFTIKMNGQSELQKVFDELLEGNTYVTIKEKEVEIEKAKQDVAREIFEEIEDLFFDKYLLGNITASLFENNYAELKKKYIGG